jgi:hypothetical protein
MISMDNLPTFREPTSGERIFNRVLGFLVGLGLGFSHNYLLEVRGRKSGKPSLKATMGETGRVACLSMVRRPWFVEDGSLGMVVGCRRLGLVAVAVVIHIGRALGC